MSFSSPTLPGGAIATSYRFPDAPASAEESLSMIQHWDTLTPEQQANVVAYESHQAAFYPGWLGLAAGMWMANDYAGRTNRPQRDTLLLIGGGSLAGFYLSRLFTRAVYAKMFLAKHPLRSNP